MRYVDQSLPFLKSDSRGRKKSVDTYFRKLNTTSWKGLLNQEGTEYCGWRRSRGNMDNRETELGVILVSGASDWQIFQQDETGMAALTLSGRYVLKPDQKMGKVVVQVRLVREDGYEAVTASLDWQAATTRPDGTWSATLRDVPRGGLYRLETCLTLDDGPIEWAIRGDMAHHLGVGDIWVITGQSNAAGYGKTPVEDGPELGIHAFTADGRWKLATHPLGDSTDTRYPPNRENANASHSPWMAFARRLKQALGYPVGLIPASLGGSPVSAWDRQSDGVLFNNMLGYLADAGTGIKGAVWYQGESDTGENERAVYKQRFAGFVEDLRREMRSPVLPVITVQLNRYVGEDLDKPVHANWESMREIQRQLSHELENVYLVSIFEAGLSDGIHNDSLGNLRIAQRVAAAALGAVYGHPIAWRHPECVAARHIAPDAVELEFRNIDGRLHYESRIGREFPFAVRDSQGEVPVAGYVLPEKDRFRITLGRPLAGPATVTGAPTANPPACVPFDIPGYRSMLGFTLAITSETGGIA